MRPGAHACTWLMAALLCLPALLPAQSVRGIGDDALTSSRGVVRVQFSTSITDFSQRYGKGSPGRPDGSLETIDADFSRDTLGVAQFPGLGVVQSALRTLTGNSGFTLNLGRSTLTSSVRVQTTPLLLEAGLTNRISLGVMVPIVSARKQALFNINGGTANGNVSFNPARLNDNAAATNAAVLAALRTAQQAYDAQYTACTANTAGAGCAAILAAAPQLHTEFPAFVQAFTDVYGGSRIGGAVFVPIAGSAADSLVQARALQFRDQLVAVGITSISGASLVPSRPTAVVTREGFARVVADSSLALRAAPLGTITHQGIGDIEVSLKVKLFDSFSSRSDTLRFLPKGMNVRQSFAGVYRFATGTIDDADNYLDIGTGSGTTAIEGRSYTDVVYGRHFFGSVIARYTVPMADQQVRRITDTPDQVFAPFYRERLVGRTLGNQLQVELTPRWVLNDFFSIGAQYLFRHRNDDKYAGTYTVSAAESGLPAPITLDATTLALETGGQEQRLGFGLTFSSVAAHARGKAVLPVEVQYFNSRTVTGSGGAVPKLSIHQLQVRLYPHF